MSDDQMWDEADEIVNQVNPSNFNQTMDGYFYYALNFAMENTSFTDEQIRFLRNGLSWAKSEMTYEDARKYRQSRSTWVEEF